MRNAHPHMIPALVATFLFLLPSAYSCDDFSSAAGSNTCSVATQIAAQATSPTNSDEEGYKSDDPVYATADAVLNEARLNMGNATSARQRIAKLEDVAARYPQYKFLSDAYYFIGLNEQLLKDNPRAVLAFETALKIEPDIANETPILSYLRAAKSVTFRRMADVVLLVILAATVLIALFRLTRPDAANLPWKRFVGVYLAVSIVWGVFVLLLPFLLGPPHSGLEPFPKPVLANFRIGQIGDAPLRALFGYGLGAILATLPIVAACARVRSRPIRRLSLVLGCLLAGGALLGLYTIRHLYVEARYQGSSARFLFLVRSIDTIQDIPDAMIPLYDADFAKKVRESRKEHTK